MKCFYDDKINLIMIETYNTTIFPYLFKKETYPECAFGIKKIQGKKYFLTKYLALQLEDEEGGN